jgi:hypothetical protein
MLYVYNLNNKRASMSPYTDGKSISWSRSSKGGQDIPDDANAIAFVARPVLQLRTWSRAEAPNASKFNNHRFVIQKVLKLWNVDLSKFNQTCRYTEVIKESVFYRGLTKIRKMEDQVFDSMGQRSHLALRYPIASS